MDLTNTSMKNMKIPEDIQTNIREFMMSTYSSLDNQRELDKFYSIISPSLRLQVTHHIFTNSIEKNLIFAGNQELIEFLINDVKTCLNLPEDQIVTQGTSAE
jgi:hypothetical protein